MIARIMLIAVAALLMACDGDDSTGPGPDVCADLFSIEGLYDGSVTINGRDEDVFVLVRGLTSWVQISWDEDLDSLTGFNSVMVYRDLDGTYYSERTVRGVVETKTSTISGCFNAFKVSYKETLGDSTVMEFDADVKKMTSRP